MGRSRKKLLVSGWLPYMVDVGAKNVAEVDDNGGSVVSGCFY